jgi:hypothetical protein
LTRGLQGGNSADVCSSIDVLSCRWTEVVVIVDLADLALTGFALELCLEGSQVRESHSAGDGGQSTQVAES